LGIVVISKKSKEIIKENKYEGYDSLFPFLNALNDKYFPYTMNWRAISALNLSLNNIIIENGIF
jgi:aspartate aminotransferase-like enzyme